MNNVTLIGRLTRDPELRYIPSGTAVSTFTLAVDRKMSKVDKADAEKRNKPTADFIRIIVWGKRAENCVNYINKGKLVGIQGRIQTGSYDRGDGTRIYTTDIVANNVEFLEWGDKKESNNNNDDYDFPDIEGFHPTDNDDIPF